MSGATEKGTTWLPNLVGGVSIWKLARDLNEPKFMDGRLLIPETEGSESLPTSVTWDVARLMPFAEAREKHPEDLEKATQDFGEALSRVADEFRKESSGYHQYREAFTVPSIEADLGGHYFFDPATKKLFAVNWGATPRALTGYQEFVFGWDRFGKAMASAATLAAAKALAAGKDPKASADADKKAQDEKDEKKKQEEKDGKKRPFWIWLLLIALFIGILLLILYLLRACEAQNVGGASDASADAQLDGASDGAAGDAEAGADASADAGDASKDAGDASADAGDAGKDAGDAGADAGKDGGKDAGPDDEDDDEDLDDDDDGTGGGGGGSGGGGSGGGGGGKKVTAGPAGGGKGGPHRVHVHPQAVEWRITSGWGKVSRTVQKGHRFDVYLGKGTTYDGVRVEYKDNKGGWHGF